MKKIRFLLVLFVCTLATVVMVAQSQQQTYDLVTFDQIQFKKTGSAQAFPAAGTPSDLVSSFGAPVSITKKDSEADQKAYTVYQYKGAEFWFDGQAADAITLEENHIAVSVNGSPAVKTGDKVDVLQAVFPDSYQLRADGTVYVGIKAHNGTVTDAGLSFSYDGKGIITQISVE